MKLIIGLGNPGKIYQDHRHNIGFVVIKALAKTCRVFLKKESGVLALSAKIKIKGQNVVLAMPLTFMNLSGIAVSALLAKYKRDPEDLLVVCDDLDLEFGRLKLKACGSSGGHRGLKSIIDSAGSQNFSRLRIGIGRPRKNMEPTKYVLLPFHKKEKARIPEILEKAGSCCKMWAREGITESMNSFNRRDR